MNPTPALLSQKKKKNLEGIDKKASPRVKIVSIGLNSQTINSLTSTVA